jgi:Apea-like HEPN
MAKHQLDIDDINFVISEVIRFTAMTFQDMKAMKEADPENDDLLFSMPHPTRPGLLIIGRPASQRLSDLGERHLATQPRLLDDSDPRLFHELLRKEFADRFLKQGHEVNKQNVEKMLSAVVKGIKAEHKALTHYIPCAALNVYYEGWPQPTEKYKEFDVGPVHFVWTEKFLAEQRQEIKSNYPKGETWAAPGREEHDEQTMIWLTDFYNNYNWVAIVSIPPCSEQVSRQRAVNTVQGALDVLKLLFGPEKSDRIRLGEARMPPEKTAQLTHDAGGAYHITASRRLSDDVGITAEVFELILGGNDLHLHTAGTTLDAYVDPQNERHLKRRYLDALSWYGEAVVEPLPSARIIRYVAAWERLTITQKEEVGLTDKVTKRIAILGHDVRAGDFASTLKKVKKIYDWRSRLMHGSSSPFEKALIPVAREAGAITRHALYQSLQVFIPLAHKIDNPKEADLEAEYERLEREWGVFTARSDWTDAAKKLPKKGVEVFVIVRNDQDVAVKDIGVIDERGVWVTYKHAGHVSHWAPVPEFPQR